MTSKLVRAYQLSNGDIFTFGNAIYLHESGLLKEMVEGELDEFGFTTYVATGRIFTTDEATERFEKEEEITMQTKLTEYQETILEKQIEETTFFNNGKTTVVIATMKNGFDVVGTSACVHREDYDMALGRHYALVDALAKVDAFIGFGRQQEAYEHKMYAIEQAEIEREQAKMVEEVNEIPTVNGIWFGTHNENGEGLQFPFQGFGKIDLSNSDVVRMNGDFPLGVLQSMEFTEPKYATGGLVSAENLKMVAEGEPVITYEQLKDAVAMTEAFETMKAQLNSKHILDELQKLLSKDKNNG